MLLIHPPPAYPISSAKVDISLLLKPDDEEETLLHQQTHHQQPPPPPPQQQQNRPSSSRMLASGPAPRVVPPGSAPMTPTTPGPQPKSSAGGILGSTPTTTTTTAGTKRHSSSSLGNEPPAKKQSKWSPEEDALIIELRGRGMKWEDISKKLPGRSAISCRLHYQNYLERRSEWDEDRKNKLARLYERFKAEMWAKVAEEMAIPWRAAEAMHWQLGEQEMARRAGVVPFSLSSGSSIEPAPKLRRNTTTTVMPRLRRQSMSVAGVSQRSMPPPHPLAIPQGMPLQGLPPQLLPPAHHPPPPLPQPQPLPQGQSQGQPQLPSVEELTAGVPAYSSSHTQPIINPYHQGARPQQPPPMNLPHPQSDLPGMSPTRTRP
ncbi:MYB DNA-binding domain protein [Talaromyces stipitatus ATCC 10500]|uniref:MYB DNA-binding domain protein n=1 Tax=Talaromyces stipitatus (strain ATCC 10500 / CBS 375.48 / QM 6759 / NRRL 1006) TaxID=441959 RepID=B8MLE0_TALSN|nr:MYB DNA-binding domain protein [Talaromyces stipitatus ATCC 10500]EED15055.1 MYB DNA-binding domain protein [Talaromyces stipitatus ATCC 10500]